MSRPRIHSVEDARRLATRVLPRVVFDYIEGGADDEVTMAANEAAFDSVWFRPKVGVGAVQPDLSCEVLGSTLELPVILAPCGLVRLMHPDGAAGAARAAQRSGTISVLSTVAGVSVEEVTRAAPGPLWFQLYAAGGRAEADALAGRAEAAGCGALVVTVDTPALGNRERDRRNGVPTPMRLNAKGAIGLGSQVLARPGWAYRMARDGVQLFSPANRRGGRRRDAHGADGVDAARDPGSKMLQMRASPFTWDDVAWLRERWNGKLLVKGVLTGEDAKAAAGSGADAVVVSNHGGRQLDGARPSLHALPEVVEAVGDGCEVLVDGGIRRGAHVVKALALGARAVLIGRPYLWGLAAGGEGGVRAVLECLREEMVRTMTLLGCPSLQELDGSWCEVT